MGKSANDDAKEFADSATGKHPDKPKNPNKKGNPPAVEAADEPGKLVQYRSIGTGFQPCSRTHKTLQSGIYALEYINNIGTIFQPHSFPTDDLIRLPDSRSDEVINEIEHFWTLDKVFKEYGYAHKRGFLLFGPQGSGKTSTLAVVARNIVKRGGLALYITNPDLATNILPQFREVEPNRPIVVIIEDIDAVIEQRGESEMLQLLDGDRSISHICFIATTNYPERLDHRVINRPSRFDRVVKIDVPSPESRAVYLRSRLPKMAVPEVDRWVKLTDGFSIAHLKELIVSVFCFENPIEQEVERLKIMSRPPKSSDGKGSVGFK